MTLSLEPFRTDVLKEIMADHKENYNNDDLTKAERDAIGFIEIK